MQPTSLNLANTPTIVLGSDKRTFGKGQRRVNKDVLPRIQRVALPDAPRPHTLCRRGAAHGPTLSRRRKWNIAKRHAAIRKLRRACQIMRRSYNRREAGLAGNHDPRWSG